MCREYRRTVLVKKRIQMSDTAAHMPRTGGEEEMIPDVQIVDAGVYANIYSMLHSSVRTTVYLLGQEFLESFLLNDNIAHGPELFAAFLLLLEQLPSS